MKAEVRALSQLLQSGDQYIMPNFQRFYVWGITEWETLWTDIKLLFEQNEQRHFLGAIVNVPSHVGPGLINKWQVIDGQQRLLTLSVILSVIRNQAHKKEFISLENKIYEKFLIHTHEDGYNKYRVLPRHRDRKIFLKIVNGDALEEVEHSLSKAFEYFSNQIDSDEFNDEQKLNELFLCIVTKIDIVSILLEGDNAFRIFKSLNSTGVDLGESDLIRNHVFMSVDLEKQEYFETNHWSSLEESFFENEKLNVDLFTSFFRDYLMKQTSNYIGRKYVFQAFETNYPSNELKPEILTKSLIENSRLYEYILLKRKHLDKDINKYLGMILDVNDGTVFPLLLRLFEMNDKGLLTDGDMSLSLKMIASFITRRIICGENFRKYGSWFSKICNNLNENTIAELNKYLIKLGWPNDEQLKQKLEEFDLYQSAYCRNILNSIELNLQHPDERVILDKCTIEHILPNKIANNKVWQLALGDNWEKIHEKWKNKLGNLTLVGDDYNNEMGDKPFKEKKEKLSISAVTLNKYFRDVENWDETEILKRNAYLSNEACKIWISPTIF